jgi:hypothetical protein
MKTSQIVNAVTPMTAATANTGPIAPERWS